MPGHVLEGVRPAPADRRDPPAAGGRGGDAAGRVAARRGDRRGARAPAAAAARARRGGPRAHEDPDPVRRVTRRILQRLDGMGKWGGYHTAFDHLARGFAGNERALAYEVGESLLAAGLLEQKPSVGQRHVYLSPRRSGDIRRLIDDGELPQGLVLPPRSGDAQAARPGPRSARGGPPRSSRSSSPTSSRRQPCGHAHVVAVLAAAQRRHERGQLGLGGDQLHRHARLHRAVAHQRLGERHERRVAGLARPAARSGGRRRGARAAALDRRRAARSPRRWSVCGGRPRICSRPCLVARARAGPARSAPGRAAPSRRRGRRVAPRPRATPPARAPPPRAPR